MPVTTEKVTLESLAGSGVAALPVAVKTQAYQAAEAYVAARCTWRTADSNGQPLEAPEPLVMAVQLLTARLLERRNSPSGVVGAGEFGVVRVSSSDRDADALIAPWRKRSSVLG